VLDTYKLTPAEIGVLHVMCCTADQLRRLETSIKGLRHLTSTGSQGQLTGHPLLAEYRSHSETLRRLANQLNLPDTDAPKQTRKRKTNGNRVSHFVKAGA
jgi:hypothetical protein